MTHDQLAPIIPYHRPSRGCHCPGRRCSRRPKWPELHRRSLAEIRKQPGCHNVQDIAINRVRNGRAANYWSLCLLSAGAADAHTAAHAALYVQSLLRRDYDLVED
jgi:hypothetical protein